MKTTKSKWFYLHTIDGVPAQYIPGQQICYANSTRGNGGVTRLAKSLKQMRKEQKLSLEWRGKQGFETSPFCYGYVRIAKQLHK